LVRAIETNAIEQFPLLSADLPQIEVHHEPDMLWVITDVPHPYLNCVLRAQLAPDNVDARISATLAHFRSRRLPMTWRVGPSTQPADLGTHLTKHGLTYKGDTVGMAVDLLALSEELPAPSGLTIERVGDLEALEKWVHPVAISFGHTEAVAKTLFDVYASLGFGQHLPFRLYVGLLEGEVVAASRLFLAAGVAGIHGLATLREARRQGIGTAMTLAPLLEARSMGYRIGVLRAAPMGLGLYRRLGFEEYCRISIYTWMGGRD
jgi:GNAT superfamily N-acetyltransferase